MLANAWPIDISRTARVRAWTLRETPYSRCANMQAQLSVQLCTQLCKCGIGLVLHELTHMGQGQTRHKSPVGRPHGGVA